MGKLGKKLLQDAANTETVLRAYAQEVEENLKPSGVGGFVENVAGDLGDIATGVGTLGLDLLKDPAGEILQTVTQHTPLPDYNHSSGLDDLVKAAPQAIVEDYKRRYGSGWKAFFQGLYEDPLAFVGDVATVASAGGYGAAKGAQAASKLPAVADDLALLAKGADVSEVGRTARVVDSIIPGAKTGGPLGGIKTSLDPTGQRVVETVRDINPTKRFVDEVVRDRVTKSSIEELRKHADELEALGGSATPQQVADLGILRHTIDLADEKGLSRVFQPSGVGSLPRGPRGIVSKRLTKKVAQEMLGESSFRHVAARDQFTAEMADRLQALPESEVANFHVTMQLDTPKSAGRIGFDDLDTVIKDESFLQDQAGRNLADSVSDDIATIRELETPDSPAYTGLQERLKEEWFAQQRAQGRRFEGFVKREEQLSPEELDSLTKYLQGGTEDTVLKAKRYVEGLSESVTSSMVPTGPLSDAFDDVNLLRHRELTKPFVGDDPARLAMAFDHAYEPLRIALDKKIRGVLPEAGAPFETIVDDLYAKLGSPTEVPSALAIDEAMQSLGRKMPGYFPQMMPTGSKADFLMKSGGSPHGIRRRSVPKVYKQSKGTLTERFLDGQQTAYVTNPAEAYTRAASQVIRFKETEKLIEDLVTELGRPLNVGEELSAGEAIVNLDGTKMAMHKHLEVAGKADDYIQAGADISDAVSKAVKASLADIADETAQVGRYGAKYAVPKVVAREMENIVKRSTGGAVKRLAFDGPTNLWRDMVLYFRPAFYVNNFLGNTTFVKLQGGSFTGVVRQLSRKYRSRIREVIPEDILPHVESGFYSDTVQRTRHLGEAAETSVGRAVEATKASTVGRGTGRVRDFLQDLNQGIENVFRRESALTAIEKEMSKRGIKRTGAKVWRSKERLDNIMEAGADPQVAKAAMKSVDQAMNDYTRMSHFERQVLRRYIAPFWSFYKHAATTLVKMPFIHPAKARILQTIGVISEEMQRDALGPVPEWLEGMMPIGPGDVEGETRFLSPRGVNPFAGVLESPLSLLHPALQVGYEQVTGRDTFTGRAFSHPDVYNDPITGMQIDKRTGEPLEKRFGGYLAPVAPTLEETLLGMIPLAGLARDTLQPGARYSATGTTIEDDSGEPLYPTDPLQKMLGFLGASTVDFNLGRYQQDLSEAQKRALSP